MGRRNSLLAFPEKGGVGSGSHRLQRSATDINDAIGCAVDAGCVQSRKTAEHRLVDVVVDGLRAHAEGVEHSLFHVRPEMAETESRPAQLYGDGAECKNRH